jgi:hypothetical protein
MNFAIGRFRGPKGRVLAADALVNKRAPADALRTMLRSSPTTFPTNQPPSSCASRWPSHDFGRAIWVATASSVDPDRRAPVMTARTPDLPARRPRRLRSRRRVHGYVPFSVLPAPANGRIEPKHSGIIIRVSEVSPSSGIRSACKSALFRCSMTGGIIPPAAAPDSGILHRCAMLCRAIDTPATDPRRGFHPNSHSSSASVATCPRGSPRSYASALAFSASNSSCVSAPASSSSLALAISAADPPPPAVSRT